jgi:putative nucleotidyltransferase with HDIG domain
MSTGQFTRPEAFLEARDDLTTIAMSSISPTERSLIVQLLARSFVQAYARALLESQPRTLADWVGRMCDAHTDVPAVPRLFEGACRSLEAFLSRNGVSDAQREQMLGIERAISQVVRKPRAGLTAASESLDETDAAINSLVMRLERADPLTAEHSRAVAAWCTRLARRLSLSEREALHVARCGMLHDVGKIATPLDILRAPRNLTSGEWVIMREHTIAGEQLVLDSPLATDYTVAVRSHHERLDGRGYPDGMDGAKIPIAVRIVTVADSFNAMIGRRPYRPAMPPGLALAELAGHSGTQFDPEIVNAMRDIVTKR